MLTELSNQFADLVDAAAPSVVQVAGRRRPASGVVYANQVIVTTIRAIRREHGLQVRSHNGSSADAELVGWDPAILEGLNTLSSELPASLLANIGVVAVRR